MINNEIFKLRYQWCFDANDVRKAKKYLNQKGYFADSLEDLDENLKLDNPRKGGLLVHVGILTELYDSWVNWGKASFWNCW